MKSYFFMASLAFLTLSIRAFAMVSETDKKLFEGTIQINGCSGALVTLKGMPKTNKALVMTNAHCVGVEDGKEVIVNRFDPYEIKVLDREMYLYPLSATKIVYATGTDTDIAFLLTNMTYKEIEEQYNIKALVLNDIETTVDQEIDVVSGYWGIFTSCKVEAISPLVKEGGWIWKNSIRYSKECMTKNGYSGSPIIAKNTRTVIGIHNTGNMGQLDCSTDNPCEINIKGRLTFFERYRIYGQHINQVYTCLNKNFQIDLKVPGCMLPKPVDYFYR